MPIPETARYEAWVGGRLLAGIAGSNSAGGMDSAIVLYNSAHVHEILGGTWRCQVWKVFYFHRTCISEYCKLVCA